MDAVLQSITSGLPVFFLHFASAVGVFVLAMLVYTRITPHKELALVREGNVAASISVAAAAIGLALPLGFCLAGSVNVYDIWMWGGAILLIQLLTYMMIDRLLGGLSRSIEQGNTAPALFLAAIKISVAILNAAAIAG